MTAVAANTPSDTQSRPSFTVRVWTGAMKNQFTATADATAVASPGHTPDSPLTARTSSG